MWKPNSIFVGNSKDLSQIPDNKISLTVTSPPYHNAINSQQHQDSKKWYRGTVKGSLEDWLKEMRDIFSEVFRVTKPGGYCCIIIGNELIEGTSKLPLPALLQTSRLSPENPGASPRRSRRIPVRPLPRGQ